MSWTQRATRAGHDRRSATMSDFDAKKVARRVIELAGGHTAAFEHFDQGFRIIQERWNQDVVGIGRILRAHLFVEHFLTAFLQKKNPALGDLDSARLSFAQKLALLPASGTSVSYLVPGIRQLNKVRNRLAHSLQAQVTEDDRSIFLAIELFRELRNERDKPKHPSMIPIDVLEQFGAHAGMMLDAAISPDATLWAQAIGEQTEEPNQSPEPMSGLAPGHGSA